MRGLTIPEHTNIPDKSVGIAVHRHLCLHHNNFSVGPVGVGVRQ